MSKLYRFTRTMPACRSVCAVGRVDSAVAGSSSPSARRVNCSVIAVDRMQLLEHQVGERQSQKAGARTPALQDHKAGAPSEVDPGIAPVSTPGSVRERPAAGGCAFWPFGAGASWQPRRTGNDHESNEGHSRGDRLVCLIDDVDGSKLYAAAARTRTVCLCQQEEPGGGRKAGTLQAAGSRHGSQTGRRHEQWSCLEKLRTGLHAPTRLSRSQGFVSDRHAPPRGGLGPKAA